MTDQQKLECLQALNASAEDGSVSRLGADCRRALEIGFFFDGMGRHLLRDQQENRVSNIGRLFSAYPIQEQSTLSRSYDRYYYSGLGTPFETSLSEDMIPGYS
ncbi:hypothetical protein DU490_16805 [Halomonas sp. DQ26W]|uniref:hypothetical protein n=1 Tax=Halomonas sp. DQ26W TaxID=2282311 RepID=UPI000DF7E11A|nr:hypothetical protein [Halomonas sp. DQ26W]RDB41752.1 hypothetical protein DU490_16805 [Halomonas sp. DQ26W]